RTAQDRQGADRRPSDGRIKTARCGRSDREHFQVRHEHYAESPKVAFSAKSTVSLSKVHVAGSVRSQIGGGRQGWRVARPRFAATALTARLRSGEEAFMRSRQALSRGLKSETSLLPGSPGGVSGAS